MSAVDDNAEVYYGTDFGIVGVADLQQLASSHQVIQLMMSYCIHCTEGSDSSGFHTVIQFSIGNTSACKLLS